MLTTEEIQKRVRDNFKNILETHAAEGLPVVVSHDDKIFHLYKDGTRVEIKSRFLSDNSHTIKVKKS